MSTFRIQYADDRGGKAGRGCNKTSSFVVVNDQGDWQRQYRFSVLDDEAESLKRAQARAALFIKDLKSGKVKEKRWRP